MNRIISPGKTHGGNHLPVLARISVWVACNVGQVFALSKAVRSARCLLRRKANGQGAMI